MIDGAHSYQDQMTDPTSGTMTDGVYIFNYFKLFRQPLWLLNSMGVLCLALMEDLLQ